MSLRRYDSYRDSGAIWLGQLPTHWDAMPLRYLVECCDGQRIPLNSEQRAEREGEVPYWGANAVMGHVDQALFDEELVLLGEDGAPFFDPVRPIAFRSVGPIWPNNHVHVLRPLQAGSAVFIAYALNATDFGDFIEGSTRDKLTQGKMMGIRVPWPPPAERIAIAAFLDRETAKIDALVEAQRRLIEVLKEKRQAVISHAVTKGLDPSAPMKDSGVEWLGEVPAHWEVCRLKQITRGLESGTSVNAADIAANQDEIGVLKTSCVYTGQFDPTENKTVVADELDRVRCPVVPGRLIVSRMNTPDLVGAAGLVTEAAPNLFLPDRLWQIELAGASPEFVHFWTQTPRYRAQVRLACEGTSSSMQNLAQDDLLGFRLALPTFEEQKFIAERLKVMAVELDELIAQAAAGNALLQERRAALISAAVTGKIDVRDWTVDEVRQAVTAEIICLHAHKPTFGRVKNQKLLYLAETHAGIHEIGGRYERQAAGPYDSDLMALVERELGAAGVMSVSQPDGRGSTVTYSVNRSWKRDRERLKAMLGDRLAAFDRVNAKLADLDTRAAEAVATLYAVWNDALIDGEACDDARVVRGFLDEWHREKRGKFKEADLRTRLSWMRRNGLVPEGRGSRTTMSRLFV